MVFFVFPLNTGSDGMTIGVIVGLSVGIIAAICIIIFIAVFSWRKYQTKTKGASHEQEAKDAEMPLR